MGNKKFKKSNKNEQRKKDEVGVGLEQGLVAVSSSHNLCTAEVMCVASALVVMVTDVSLVFTGRCAELCLPTHVRQLRLVNVQSASCGILFSRSLIGLG